MNIIQKIIEILFGRKEDGPPLEEQVKEESAKLDALYKGFQKAQSNLKQAKSEQAPEHKIRQLKMECARLEKKFKHESSISRNWMKKLEDKDLQERLRDHMKSLGVEKDGEIEMKDVYVTQELIDDEREEKEIDEELLNEKMEGESGFDMGDELLVDEQETVECEPEQSSSPEKQAQTE